MANEQEFELYREFSNVYSVDPDCFERYGVKRGLRNADGTGVLAGVTKISNVHGYVISDDERVPAPGSLTYRGFEIENLVNDAVVNDHSGFEHVAYLLLAGRYPSPEHANEFQDMISGARDLSLGFINNIIADAPPRNIMNALMRAVIALYALDPDVDATGDEAIAHEIRAAVSVIAKMPRFAVLGYHAKQAYYENGSMYIHPVILGQNTAETILSMLRPDRQFTPEEARLLDIMLMIHAEHGGGNNSTFTCRCLTSTGTDPYSAYAGAIASLKGPRHGGANLSALEQQEDLKANVANWRDEGQVADYLRKTFAGETFDRSGLVYGMGHAVYTLSDPRATLCKKYAQEMAAGTEFEDQFKLIETIERLTPEIMAEVKGGTKKVLCANVDMYSGLVYTMLGIPKELFTPLFACARIVGWAAHRFEEIYTSKRIMRPAYKSLATRKAVSEVDFGQ